MLQSYTEYVKRYGIAELVFRGPSEGNPFAEQWVKGTMAGQAEEKRAEGFYDGNGVYKLRFMPSCEGTYEITAVTSWGDEAKVTVEVSAADENCHGPVRESAPRNSAMHGKSADRARHNEMPEPDQIGRAHV